MMENDLAAMLSMLAGPLAFGAAYGGVRVGLSELKATSENLARLVQRLDDRLDLMSQTLAYEQKLAESQASIIVAEATSSSWLTTTWRPITMLVFVALVVRSELTGATIPPDLWFTIKLGLGGYLGGRSVEKSVGAITQVMKQKDEV